MGLCLLLGNGINLCLENSVSWSSLLENIAGDNTINPNYSYTLTFEILMNQILKKALPLENTEPQKIKMYGEIKEKIIDGLKQMVLDSDAPHFELVKAADVILTTNYDYLIEEALKESRSESEESISAAVRKKNSSWIWYPHYFPNAVNGMRVYHIHGEFDYPASIVLGYSHYANLLHELRRDIGSERNIGKGGVEETSGPRILNRLSQRTKQALDDKAFLERGNAKVVWGRLFFTEDVHIIGFGLAKEELDLWWLIVYRASLLNAYPNDTKKLIHNKIVFHDVHDIGALDFPSALKGSLRSDRFQDLREMEQKLRESASNQDGMSEETARLLEVLSKTKDQNLQDLQDLQDLQKLKEAADHRRKILDMEEALSQCEVEYRLHLVDAGGELAQSKNLESSSGYREAYIKIARELQQIKEGTLDEDTLLKGRKTPREVFELLDER